MRSLYPQLNPDEFVVVGLSLETNLSSNRLAGYADSHGFNWRFAVMTPEMLTAVVEQFGSQAAVAPRTPHFIISPNGALSPLRLGIKSEAEILAEFQEYSRIAN